MPSACTDEVPVAVPMTIFATERMRLADKTVSRTLLTVRVR